jgi:hypothetical protein
VARGDETDWRVFLEPTFLRAPVVRPIPAAKRTVIALGFLADEGLQPYTAQQMESMRVEAKEFEKQATKNAAADLATLKPRFERDAHKTILYGALESEKPIVASAVLAPGFLDLWKDTLGESILVAVPNRFTAYIFPRLASTYQSYSPMVFRAYRETAHPVSVEVFEVSKAGWRCVGVYEEP